MTVSRHLRLCGAQPTASLALVACALWLSFGCAQSQLPNAQTPPGPPSSAAIPAARVAPKLVVSVVIDQMGSDTLLALEPLLADDGLLAHVRAQGVVYEQVVYPYAATLTAPGHAAIYTGVEPAESGVVANYVVDQATSAKRPAEDDGVHATLGGNGFAGEGFAGPGVLQVDTVGDALKAATQNKARVVSLSIKARSAVLPGGQHPDAVLWYSAGLPGFTTSTYYATERPAWVVDFERAHPIDAASVVWNAFDPQRLSQLLGPDAAPGEGDQQGLGVAFPHRLANTANPNDAWAFVPDSAEYLLELAYEAVERLELGQDDVPDLLAISISSTDYTGHVFGPNSWEYADHLRRVDSALMRLIERLAKQTQLAVLVTSDHGVAPLPEYSRPKHADALRFEGSALTKAVESAVESAVGGSGWVLGYDVPYMLLSAAAHADQNQAQIRSVALNALRAQPGVAAAFDTRDLAALDSASDALSVAVRRSIHPATSGDFFVVASPYAVPDLGLPKGAGTSHGSPWQYDSHVPVLLWAHGIAQARHPEDLDQRRVAPTLSALLRVPPPSHARQPALPFE